MKRRKKQKEKPKKKLKSATIPKSLGRHHHPPLKIHHPLLNVLWYLKKEHSLLGHLLLIS
ncbi:MAG: hypothetical protein OEY24_08020 [Candidatus Bathyarchaeota archaeon]|nr:hypothetical protein [Candidatus Bathyarchaeota archaeon]